MVVFVEQPLDLYWSANPLQCISTTMPSRQEFQKRSFFLACNAGNAGNAGNTGNTGNAGNAGNAYLLSLEK